MKMQLSVGKKVFTEHGVGLIVSTDGLDSTFRFGVNFPTEPLHFDGEKFSFRTLYYFPTELKISPDDENLCVYDVAKRQEFNLFSHK